MNFTKPTTIETDLRIDFIYREELLKLEITTENQVENIKN